MIDRRSMMAGVLGSVGAPAMARAQSPRAAAKIGCIFAADAGPSHVTYTILRTAWRELGYVEGETVLVRGRAAENFGRAAAELIALGAGVLIVFGPYAIKAARQVTPVTPIVAVDLETDPVRAGYATSFARPGGNITGLFMDTASLAGKWIELLRQAAPSIERVAIVWDPVTGPDQLEVAKAAARSNGMDAVVVEARQAGGYDDAFGGLGRPQRTGVVQLTAPALQTDTENILRAAQKYGLPTITFLKQYAQIGMLLSYGPNLEAYFPRAVVLADRILKGAKAADLPIEQPTKFELAVNLKTARALGLTLPPSILARADEVIE